jgi:competence protein ComEC
MFGAALAAFLFIAGVFSRKARLVVAGILILSAIAGFWRFDIAWERVQSAQTAGITGKSVAVDGIVASDPVFGDLNQQLVVETAGIAGKIMVVTRRYPEYAYGDRIKFNTILEMPQNTSDFDYRNYLAKDGVYFAARYPEIESISHDNGNPVYALLLNIKHALKDSLGKSLPSPHNTLLAAILLGDQSGLASCSTKEIEADPDCAKLKEKLNISGLRHLAAVSGTHVSIVGQILVPIFIALGMWRGKARRLTLMIMWLFVAMIGLPASAVRAGIMGSLLIGAQMIGRPGDALHAITVAAAAMVLQNPLILRFDIGFQLSFLAVLGMVFFAWPVENKIKRILPKPQFVAQALAIALAAQILTLPVLVYNFGYVSPYSLLANVLVEPIVPFVTVYGFVLAIAGMVHPAIGWFLFFPMWLLLSYLLAVANFFSSLPGAVLNVKINFVWFLISYAILAFFAWRVSERQKMENLI